MNETNKIIPPSVGRQVHFHLASPDVTHIPGWGGAPNNTYAATVACVHSDRLVNLSVIDASGYTYGMQSIPLCQIGDERPLGNWCEWPPYQKGQAAKTEKAELTAETLLHAIGTRINEALSKDPHAFTRAQVMTIFGLREPREVFAPPAGDPPPLNTPVSRAEKLADAIAMNQYAGDPQEAVAILAGQGAPSAGTHPAIAETHRLDDDGNPLVDGQSESTLSTVYQDHQYQARKRHEDELQPWQPAPTIPQD